jgi:DtxR family Mn-dependent transcriptional regulator
MYLITVARATEEGTSGPVPVGTIAAALEVSVASANEMVRKLAGRGFLDYLPYKGVVLTDTGRRIAGTVLRTRRLWATFLVQHLGFTARDADALACHFEHVTPPEAVARLAAYLGDPVAGPLGKPIPPGRGAPPPRRTTPLTEVPVGTPAEIVTTGAGDAAAFLTAEGVTPGATVTVAASGASGVLIDVAGHRVHLVTAIAASIAVTHRETA